MPIFGGKKVKITDVSSGKVQMIHIRRKGERPHPDSGYSVPHRGNKNLMVDHIEVEEKKARRGGLARWLGLGGSDSSGEDSDKGGGWGLDW